MHSHIRATINGSWKGAHAWRHHGKFTKVILILMLLTAPSSTATRLHGSGGAGGRPIVMDDDSLDGSKYLINAKSAVEYGTEFTNSLVHHLEVHGVDAKYESREWIIGQVEKVLDEMRSVAVTRDEVEGSQSEQGRAQAGRKTLDSLKDGSDDVPENHLDGNGKILRRGLTEARMAGGAFALAMARNQLSTQIMQGPSSQITLYQDLGYVLRFNLFSRIWPMQQELESMASRKVRNSWLKSNLTWRNSRHAKRPRVHASPRPCVMIPPPKRMNVRLLRI